MIPGHIWMESTQRKQWIFTPDEIRGKREAARQKGIRYKKICDDALKNHPEFQSYLKGDQDSTGITPFIAQTTVRGVMNTPSVPVQTERFTASSPIVQDIAKLITSGMFVFHSPSADNTEKTEEEPICKKEPDGMLEGDVLSSLEEVSIVNGYARHFLDVIKTEATPNAKTNLYNSFKNWELLMAAAYTTILYVRRYYLFEPVVSQTPNAVFATAFLLAAKSEDVSFKDEIAAQLFDCPSKDIFPDIELELIEKLKFHITVYHPYSNPTPSGLSLFGCIKRIRDVLLTDRSPHLQRLVEATYHANIHNMEKFLATNPDGTPKLINGAEQSQLNYVIRNIERYTGKYIEQAMLSDLLLLISPMAIICMCLSEGILSTMNDDYALTKGPIQKGINSIPIPTTRLDLYQEMLNLFGVDDDPANIIAHLKYLAFGNILNSTDPKQNIPGLLAPSKLREFDQKFSPSSNVKLALGNIARFENMTYTFAMKRLPNMLIPLKIPGTAINNAVKEVCLEKEREVKHAARGLM